MSTPAIESSYGRMRADRKKSLTLWVSAHVEAETGLDVTLHPVQDLVVVWIEGANHTEVRLYLDAPDLRRLHDVLGTAITDLTAQRADLDTTATTTPVTA